MNKFMDIKQAKDIYYKVYDHNKKEFTVPDDVTVKELLMAVRTLGKALYQQQKKMGKEPIKFWPIMDAPESMKPTIDAMAECDWVALIPNYLKGAKLPFIGGEEFTEDLKGGRELRCY